MKALITLDDLHVMEDEPRIRDLRLAEALGFAQVYDIRKLIGRSSDELQGFGTIFATMAQNKMRPDGTVETRGRPSTEYHLNEAQALLISMFSQTRRAADVRKQLIEVFMAWRRGDLTPPVRAAQVHDPVGDAFRRMSERLSEIEKVLRFSADYPAPAFSNNVTYLPIWTSGKRPRFWKDADVRAFLTNTHRQMTTDQAWAECVARFGKDRTPARSSIGNYWQRLDKARGVVA